MRPPLTSRSFQIMVKRQVCGACSNDYAGAKSVARRSRPQVSYLSLFVVFKTLSPEEVM
jgi:hypothetical protein